MSFGHRMADRWRLDGFEHWLQVWIGEYSPPLERIRTVREWIQSRETDPLAGVRFVPGFSDYLFGWIPGTLDAADRVVTCTYWLDRAGRAVRCDLIETQSWPVS